MIDRTAVWQNCKNSPQDKMAHSRYRSQIGLVRQNWTKNHRFRGGIAAVARCLAGSLYVDTLKHCTEAVLATDHVDCVVFSVIPGLTTLWARALNQSTINVRKKIWIGDCSGGFRARRSIRGDVNVLPIVNEEHGVKIDTFLRKICTSRYVFISDDDVLWLSPAPWEWAMNALTSDHGMAVASLLPRERFRWWLDGESHQPMGSYCLFIDRGVFLREGLSFQSVNESSPNPQSYLGKYDTADYANVELIRRKYRIAIAPEEIRRDLATFKGISSAMLGIQKSKGSTSDMGSLTDKQSTLVRCLVARGISKILVDIGELKIGQSVLPQDMLERAIDELGRQLPSEMAQKCFERAAELVVPLDRLLPIIGPVPPVRSLID
jgi:hypothetical protein